MIRTFFIIISFVVFTPAVMAQITPGTGNLPATIRPEFAGPNTPVEISLSSITDLNISEISWYVDGQLTKAGTGEKGFVFRTGSVGKKTTVEVTVKPPGKIPLTGRYVFIPAEVDLLWEARGYTHPFYAGKTLFAARDKLNFQAVPNFTDASGNSIPASDLIYAWKSGTYNLPKQSGYGRDSATITGATIRPFEEVEVTVSTEDKSMIATSKVLIPENKPDIVLYENHPLYGTLFNRAVSNNFTLTGRELSLEAVPFHFGTLSRDDKQLEYKWYINGIEASASPGNKDITLRQESGMGGSSAVRLKMEFLDNIFQFAEESTVLKFNEQ